MLRKEWAGGGGGWRGTEGMETREEAAVTVFGKSRWLRLEAKMDMERGQKIRDFFYRIQCRVQPKDRGILGHLVETAGRTFSGALGNTGGPVAVL